MILLIAVVTLDLKDFKVFALTFPVEPLRKEWVRIPTAAGAEVRLFEPACGGQNEWPL